MEDCIPKIAVALAVYNGEKWISEQIGSILSQQKVDVDIYISVDYSEDNSSDLCREWANKNKNIFLLTSEADFGSGANNFYHLLRSIPLDNYDYVSLSDQDDIWQPLKIDRGIACLSENECEGYSSNLKSFRESKVEILRKDYKQRRFDYLFQGASAGCTYVLSKNLVEIVKNHLNFENDHFVQGSSHDWLIYAICRANKLGWFHDKQSFIMYRQHEDNAYGDMAGWRGIQKKITLMRSGWYRKHILWISEVLSLNGEERIIIERVERLNLGDRWYLALRVNQLRRSLKEGAFLSFAMIFGIFR